MGGFPTLESGKLKGKLVDFLYENGGNREFLKTIAFDWKISPQSVQDANQFTDEVQLTPGQVITHVACAAGAVGPSVPRVCRRCLRTGSVHLTGTGLPWFNANRPKVIYFTTK